MFSFSSSMLPYSYPLKASIHLCLTFCFKVSAAPSFKSPALSVLTTFPCVLHNFLCLSQLTKLFSASYICGVFTSFLDIPNFPSKSRNAAVLSLTYTSSLCRIYSPQDFPVFTTHLLNFWCFCHTTELPLQPLVGLRPCYHFGLLMASYSSSQPFSNP